MGVREFARLDDAARAIVVAADTFFIGSSHAPSGADASHRGGPAGFVEVSDDRTLRWPDYAGNSMYMTLGNMVEAPHVGLLFPDWQSGAALQLSGRARIDWDGAAVTRFPGARRVIEFTLERALLTSGASPLVWTAAQPSPFSPPPRKKSNDD